MPIPISNVTRRVVYAASGTGPYAFTFEILANTDIAVFRDDTLLTLTTDYTVTIAANGTGSITLVAAPTGATQIAIVGNRTIQRTTDFVTGGDFFANTVNDEMDQQTIFAQQNAEGLQRALSAPQTDPTSINMTLPRASLRANKALGFDANGKLLSSTRLADRSQSPPTQTLPSGLCWLTQLLPRQAQPTQPHLPPLLPPVHQMLLRLQPPRLAQPAQQALRQAMLRPLPAMPRVLPALHRAQPARPALQPPTLATAQLQLQQVQQMQATAPALPAHLPATQAAQHQRPARLRLTHQRRPPMQPTLRQRHPAARQQPAHRQQTRQAQQLLQLVAQQAQHQHRRPPKLHATQLWLHTTALMTDTLAQKQATQVLTMTATHWLLALCISTVLMAQ
jgi:hypothetical protein